MVSAGAQPEVAAEHASVIRQLARTPRVFALAAAMLLAAVTAGTREVTRLALISDVADSQWGVSTVASVIAVAGAIAAFTVGRSVDRVDPRRFLLAAIAIGIVTSMLSFVLVRSGALSLPWLLITSAADAVSVGLSLTSMLKVQATIVTPSAVGGAEMLNVLRLGLGGVIGAVLAEFIGSVAVTLAFSAAALTAALVLAWTVLIPVRPSLDHALQAKSTARLSAYLRKSANMRRLVTFDLALTFVIPTQLVNLVLIGEGLEEIVSLSIGAAMIGVLVGRAALLGIGFRGRPSTILRMTMLGLLVCQSATAFMFIDNWLLDHHWLVAADIALATVLLTYGQGFLSALIQQDVAESVRGRLGGMLVGARAILVSVAALGAAAVEAAFGPQTLLIVLAAGLVIVLVATRGFRGVHVDNP